MRIETTESYQARISRVLLHIERNLDAPLPLDELAGVARFSPYHFHRVFRGMVGEPVKEHVRRLRLERAAQRLKNTNRTVLEIALDAGYEAPESFARAFEALFEVAPSVYRKQSGTAPSRIAANPLAPVEASIRKLDPLRVAYVRHVGPYREAGRAWGTLTAWAGRSGLLGPGFRPLGIVLDDMEITPPEKLRYDAAMALPRDAAPSGGVGIQDLPGGDYAVALHVGPYETSGVTYAALCGGWLPGTGRELRAAPAIEFYLNSPLTTSPDRLRTELWLPLED